MGALRVIKFMDTGDLAAPKGTPSWCLAVREEARAALQSAKSTREQVQSWVAALREDDRFRQLTDARGDRFLTWDAFCQEPPPHGFGMTAQEVEELIASKPPAQRMAADLDVKPLAKHGNQEGENNSRNRDDKIKSVPSPSGTSVSYLVRRLKRDAPEVAEALARGEYRSARAAGIAAGIVKVPTRLEVAKKDYLKLSKKERERFIAWIGEQNGGEL